MEAFTSGTPMDYVPVTVANVERMIDLRANQGPFTLHEVAELRDTLATKGPKETQAMMVVKMKPYIQAQDEANGMFRKYPE